MASSSPASLAATCQEAGGLVFRVVQLGEAVGDFAAHHEQLEAFGDAGRVSDARASGDTSTG
jgi:hypothetical protein